MAGVGPLVDAGATDIRVNLAIPAGEGPATEFLSEVVAAFRSATA
jgi:hypothetical protein